MCTARRIPASRRPPLFAVVIAHRDGRVLLVHNRKRRVWELPGGWIDPGETPAQCALRELAEESACHAGALRLLAWIGLQGADTPDASTTWGAVYAAEVGAPTRSEPDPEISAVMTCRADALPTPTSAIDAWLLRQFPAAQG